MNDSTSPGTIPIISALHSCQLGSGFDVSRASYTTLYETRISIHDPSTTNIKKFAHTIPKNLPITNSRRLIGFDSSVRAVRPSISSATETLAVHTATKIERTMIVIRPESLYIFTSSPNVLYGI